MNDTEEVVYAERVKRYSLIQKNEILMFPMTLKELESFMLSLLVSERQIQYNFTHMLNLRNKINEERGEEREKTRNTHFTTDNRLTVIRGVASGGGLRRCGSC